MPTKKQTKQNYNHYVALAAIMLIGFFVRVYDLRYWDLGPDDTFNLIFFAFESIKDFIFYSTYDNNHPPIWFFLGYLWIKISSDDLFLRFMSIIPGMAFIFIMFEIGKKIKGVHAGLFLAALTSVGYMNIVLSILLRGDYPLMLCFLGIGFIYLQDYLKKYENKYLWRYIAISFLALFTQYPAIIVVTGILIYVSGKIFFDDDRKLNKQKITRLALWVIPNVIILALIYLYALEQKPFRHVWYVDNPYPSDMKEYAINLYNIIGYYLNFAFKNGTEAFLFLLFAAGFGWMIYKKQYEIVSIAGCIMVVQIILTNLKHYPFAAERHSAHLYPYLMLPAAVLIEDLFNFLKQKISKNKKFKKKKINAEVICYGIIILITVTQAINVASHKFYRMELDLPPNAQSRQGLFGKLKNNIKPGDIVITEGEYARFFIYKDGYSAVKKVSEGVFFTEHQGIPVYYLYHNPWAKFENVASLNSFLRKLKNAEILKPNANIWYIRFGPIYWQVPLSQAAKGQWGEFADMKPFISNVYESYGGVYFSISHENIKKYFSKKNLEF